MLDLEVVVVVEFGCIFGGGPGEMLMFLCGLWVMVSFGVGLVIGEE